MRIPTTVKAWLGHTAKSPHPAAKAKGSSSTTSKLASEAEHASTDTAAATDSIAGQKQAPSPAGTLEIPASRSHWRALPTEIKEAILRECEDDTLWNLAKTSAETRKIATELPSLPWRQTLLMKASQGKLEDELVDVLRQHLPTLRGREKAFLLPRTTCAATLQKIAALVDGSQQRPLLVVHLRSELAKLGPIPAQIEIFCETDLRFVPRALREDRNIVLAAIAMGPLGAVD